MCFWKFMEMLLACWLIIEFVAAEIIKDKPAEWKEQHMKSVPNDSRFYFGVDLSHWVEEKVTTYIQFE